MTNTRTIHRFEEIDESLCLNFQEHLEIVGRKWTSGILLAGMRGARRFGEYRAHVVGISDRLLAQRFRELEAEGMVVRQVTPTSPVLVEYVLTERAVSLMGVLQPLVKWGIEHPRTAEQRESA